jgi:hypothetical protein
MKLSGLGKILYRVRCKWENDIGNGGRESRAIVIRADVVGYLWLLYEYCRVKGLCITNQVVQVIVLCTNGLK